MEGRVFNIQKFCIHDGPGIRTTVFLKGCPLRCQWCHNPESLDKKPMLSFIKDKCSNCGHCLNICPHNCHSINDTVHYIDRTNCTSCGLCAKHCLNSALDIVGKNMSVDEIMKIVMDDAIFYHSSNGGLTISGGEPLLQTEFVIELLKSAKEHGINTCIESSGFTSTENLLKVIPYTDLFLYDYKETNKSRHIELTGVSNELILTNLDILYKYKCNIILRCPIIPGCNDRDEHFQGILNLKNMYPDLKGIEIMPYHNLGVNKFDRYGINDNIHKEFRVPTNDEINNWKKIIY